MITNTTQGQKSLALLLDEIEEEWQGLDRHFEIAVVNKKLVKALRRAMEYAQSSQMEAEIAAILEKKEA